MSLIHKPLGKIPKAFNLNVIAGKTKYLSINTLAQQNNYSYFQDAASNFLRIYEQQEQRYPLPRVMITRFPESFMIDRIQLKFNRSSHQRCSVRKGVLRNFKKLTGKDMYQSLCLLKKRFQHRYFPVNFAKFPITPFLQNTCRRLFLISITRPQHSTLHWSKQCN